MSTSSTTCSLISYFHALLSHSSHIHIQISFKYIYDTHVKMLISRSTCLWHVSVWIHTFTLITYHVNMFHTNNLPYKCAHLCLLWQYKPKCMHIVTAHIILWFCSHSVGDALLEAVTEVMDDLGTVRVYIQGLGSLPPPLGAHSLDPLMLFTQPATVSPTVRQGLTLEDVCCYIYTSGTTGKSVYHTCSCI